MYDLLIKNGRIADGSGMPSFIADVGIVEGRITDIGHLGTSARQVIDASGLVVAPGFIDTELTREVLGEQGIREMVAKVPARRMGSPEEVARLVLWLASNENTYMSAQNIVIDGGFTRV